MDARRVVCRAGGGFWRKFFFASLNAVSVAELYSGVFSLVGVYLPEVFFLVSEEVSNHRVRYLLYADVMDVHAFVKELAPVGYLVFELRDPRLELAESLVGLEFRVVFRDREKGL